MKTCEVMMATTPNRLNKYFGKTVIKNWYDEEAADMILDLQEKGIHEFYITDHSSALFKLLTDLTAAGAKIEGRALIDERGSFDSDSYETIEALKITIEG